MLSCFFCNFCKQKYSNGVIHPNHRSITVDSCSLVTDVNKHKQRRLLVYPVETQNKRTRDNHSLIYQTQWCRKALKKQSLISQRKQRKLYFIVSRYGLFFKRTGAKRWENSATSSGRCCSNGREPRRIWDVTPSKRRSHETREDRKYNNCRK